jgi:hypothetical protein
MEDSDITSASFKICGRSAKEQVEYTLDLEHSPTWCEMQLLNLLGKDGSKQYPLFHDEGENCRIQRPVSDLFLIWHEDKIATCRFCLHLYDRKKRVTGKEIRQADLQWWRANGTSAVPSPPKPEAGVGQFVIVERGKVERHVPLGVGGDKENTARNDDVREDVTVADGEEKESTTEESKAEEYIPFEGGSSHRSTTAEPNVAQNVTAEPDENQEKKDPATTDHKVEISIRFVWDDHSLELMRDFEIGQITQDKARVDGYREAPPTREGRWPMHFRHKLDSTTDVNQLLARFRRTLMTAISGDADVRRFLSAGGRKLCWTPMLPGLPQSSQAQLWEGERRETLADLLGSEEPSEQRSEDVCLPFEAHVRIEEDETVPPNQLAKAVEDGVSFGSHTSGS